ncbi:MAG TPA: SUMF1/EgtB/PvdO family nonheme iron enzyme, partial [Vicinamibacteria bacterium]
MVRAAGPALAVVSQAVLILAGVTEGKRPFPGMVSLPGGTFRMGTERAAIDGLCRRFGTTHRDLFLPEIPAHTVTLRPFSIDRTEVTNVDYEAFVERRPEWAPGRVAAESQNGDYLKHWKGGTFPSGAADVAVTYV